MVSALDVRWDQRRLRTRALGCITVAQLDEPVLSTRHKKSLTVKRRASKHDSTSYVPMNIDFSTTLKAVLLTGYGFGIGGLACYFGEMVKTESTSICDAAYSVQWYNHSTKLRKILQMVIMRAQRPCMIYAGPSIPVTLEHFRKVVNISYSYFTLLLQMMKEPVSD